MKKYIFSFLVLLIFGACAGDQSSSNKLSSRNLLAYGVPITIMAPDSAKVETMDFKVTKDISIKDDKGYYVQIFASPATTNRIDEMKAAQLDEVKANPYFSQIIKDEPAGFIYETKVDSTLQNFGFRYIQLKGDQEYIFQTGLIGTFTLEQVEQMYEAVKPAVE